MKSRLQAILSVWLLGIAACAGGPQKYIDRGNRFFDAHKYDDAAIQYEKALQKDPDSGDAHYRLALVELERKHAAVAYGELQKAVELMPESLPAVFRLGQLAFTAYNADANRPPQLLERAKTSADKLLSMQSGGYEGNVLQAALDLAGKKPGEAAARLRAALKARPDDSDASLGLARALVQDEQASAGLDLARQVILKDKSFGPAYDFLYEQYMREGRLPDAENILREKVSNNPKQAAYVLELARYYVLQKRPTDVAVALKRLADDPADFPNGHLLAGDFYSSAGTPDLAIPQYEAGLLTTKDKNLYRRRLAGLFVTQRKFPEAYQHLDECIKSDSGDQDAKLMRAEAWLEEGRPDKLDPAIAELKEQLTNRPAQADLHFRLGTALVRKGDEEGGVREWSAAARQNGRYLPPRYALAEKALSDGRNQDALRISEEIVAVAPRDEQALVLHVTCETATGQFQRAQSELTRLSAEFPASTRVQVAMGNLALAQKKYSDAERIFQQLSRSGADAAAALSGLTQALLGRKEPGNAIQALQDALKRNPGSADLRQILARTAMVTGQFDVAIEQYRQLDTAFPGSVDVQRALASAWSAQGNSAAAVAVLQPAVQKNPANAPASLDFAHALIRAGRSGDAKLEYRRILKIQPDNANALNDLSYLMSQSGENLDEALALARKGTQFAADEGLKTSLQDTLGSIYLKKRMLESALQSFRVAADNRPENTTYRYHLGLTLYEMGNKPRAKAELQAALAVSARLGGKTKSEDESKIRELLARL